MNSSRSERTFLYIKLKFLPGKMTRFDETCYEGNFDKAKTLGSLRNGTIYCFDINQKWHEEKLRFG